MSILIKGMEMPKDRPQLLWVYPNGMTLPVQSDVDPWKELQAIPVPDHGRLIDADALCKVKGISNVAIGYINRAPTIIPSDKEGV